jgi:translation initiation factor 3 subunit L
MEAIDMVNAAVQDFIFDLHQSTRVVQEQSEIDLLYTVKFPELTKKYYGDKSSAWPAGTVIASLTLSTSTGKGDDYFLCFYKEMCDRQGRWGDGGRSFATEAVSSWKNYCALFDGVIACGDLGMVINEQWAFDIVHEFVYAFQTFAQYGADLGILDAYELEILQANPMWSVQGVTTYLQRLVKVSNVAECMAGRGGEVDFRESLPTPSRLHFDLGYFALISLSRLECLVGDYHGSIAALAPLDLLSENQYYHRVFSAYLNLFYHAGVSYLMMRRYVDALKALGHVVSYVSRLAKTGALHQVAGAEEHAAKRTAERCATLLAIVAALCPGAKIDDVVHGMGKEGQRNLLERLSLLEQASDASDFEALFEKACPKFVSGRLPDFAGHASAAHEPVRRQVDLFAKQVSQQLGLAKTRSFLKLYTTIEVEKLAKFHGSTAAQFRAELLASKHRMTQIESKAGSTPLGGELASALDVGFFVDGDVVQIDDGAEGGGGARKDAKTNDSFFMEEILRCEAVGRQLSEAAAKPKGNARSKKYADGDD